MSKKTKSSKPAPKGKKLSAPMKAGLKAVAATSGSKLSQVIALLSRPEGVTLEELMKPRSGKSTRCVAPYPARSRKNRAISLHRSKALTTCAFTRSSNKKMETQADCFIIGLGFSSQ